MTKRMIAVVGAAVLALAGAPSQARTVEDPTGAMLPLVTSAATVSYIQSAGQIDLFEIAAAKLALQRSKRADVQAFAVEVARAHQDAAARLQGELIGLEPTISLPAQLDAEHQAGLAALERAGEADFDRLYIEGQVAAQHRALKLHQAYVDGGDDSQIKTVARGAAAMAASHLEAAKTLSGRG
ncbi:DUF4142 domain-containing protein [Oleomonas cavernae]|uniref:DUF4142 domain-containing protein n=1 Tax=Oleomonas cavernae TaxID=2320859 RepID=A0A418WEG7_9PROT|nr:DUF4142 domain-containing protein [Oleomonas cavernae]RJF88418.1 DUF4142 domain-containing protein [Oleomonas cavernae]